MTRSALPAGSIRHRRVRGAAATLAFALATLGTAIGLAPSAAAEEPVPTPGEEETDPSRPAEPPTDSTEDPADPSPTGSEPAEPAPPPAPADPAAPAEQPPAEDAPVADVPAEDVSAEGGVGVLATPIEGDFGTGKLNVSVRPDEGNYPRNPDDPSLPADGVDLGGAVIGLVDVTDPANPVDLGTCTTFGLAQPFAQNGSCTVLIFAPFDIFFGRSYVATLLSAPNGFLVDPDSPVSFTVDDPECGGGPVNQTPTGEIGTQAVAEGCSNLIFEIDGAYRTVGVSKTSSVDGTPLAGATYTLCGTPLAPPPVDETPQAARAVVPTPGDPSNGACPEGTEELDETTTGPDGTGIFADGPYLPGDYTVFETVAPAGYVLDPNLQDFTVPEADDEAEVADPVLVALTDAADVPPPLAVVDEITVPSGGSVLIPVSGNDSGNGAPITLVSVTQPAHGTTEIVPDPACPAGQTCTAVVRYTPAAGYAGVDSFTYTIATRGGSSTAAVNITVTAAPVAGGAGSPGNPARPPNLAVTGTDIDDLLAAGVGLVGAGALLLAGASLTRRREHALAG